MEVGTQQPWQAAACVSPERSQLAVALLTGGSDKPYVVGLVPALVAAGATLDLIGSDELACPELSARPGVTFFNFRGSQRSEVSFQEKASRISRCYARLVRYAAVAKPKIFHILWNNKFETLDRTVLMVYYRALKKKIVLTVHNVNTEKRDSRDTPLNRLTLRVQYRLANHIFVHTEDMKRELIEEYGVRTSRVTVIPFGINNSVPNTDLTPRDARHRLGIPVDAKTILFFGRIAPYKGLDTLIAAFRRVQAKRADCRLIIAGRPDRCDRYWKTIREDISEEVRSGRVLVRSEFIPDQETELYFKAADVCVLPYRNIYQSGVLVLAYSFGLPVVASGVGGLLEEIIDGKTGYLVPAQGDAELAGAIDRYFDSELYAGLDWLRHDIREYAAKRYSWNVVSRMTIAVYEHMLGRSSDACHDIHPADR